MPSSASSGRARAAIAAGPSVSKSAASGRSASSSDDSAAGALGAAPVSSSREVGVRRSLSGRSDGARGEVHADPEQDAALGPELGQHAGELALLADDVVGPAQAGIRAEAARALDGGDAAREAEHRELVLRAARVAAGSRPAAPCPRAPPSSVRAAPVRRAERRRARP